MQPDVRGDVFGRSAWTVFQDERIGGRHGAKFEVDENRFAGLVVPIPSHQFIRCIG